MASQPDINQLIQKTRRYEFSDGLRDIQFAILLGFGGVGAWLAFEPFWLTIIMKAAKSYGRWAAWIGMLPTILVLLAVWGMLWLMKYIRQRWLWRESGIVKASQWIVPRRVNIISFIIMLAGLALGVGLWFPHWVDQVFVQRMLWTATGWSFGYTLVSVGKNIGLPRYIWLGWAGGIISTSILIIPLTFGQSALVFGSIWFVMLMTSGIMTLRSAFLAAKSGN